ncbi:MAG: aldehyde dehydrogenase family protein [Solirubrobacterales bacterium]|nr:aldehyde dehydrogenase family protein [Solirubrobacterales bacterium]
MSDSVTAGTVKSFNPYDPAEVVTELPVTGPDEVERALSLAVEAQPAWAADAPGRSAALGRLAELVGSRKEQFVDLMVREVGKPVPEAAGEVDRAVAILRYYSQVALDSNGETYPGSTPGAQVLVRRDPVGVVMAICPWNFPLAIPLWKAAPALAYGNAVLIKPAGVAIAVADLLSELAAEALPAGTFAQLRIDGRRAGDLLDDPRIAAVTFTGSTAVGLSVAERMARRGAPAQAEMGGQNAAVVRADADLDRAADAIVSGAMGFAGQKCTATRRVVAVAEIADELEAKLIERVETLGVGDPAADGVAVGPLIDATSAGDFERAVAAAIEAGGLELARAGNPAAEGGGHMVRPALIRQDDPQAEVNQEETFGPLLTLIRVEDDEQAIAAANATRYGLTGAVHGRDLGQATELASRLECGLKRVNAPTPGVDYYAPFGGEGASSFGPREQGRAAAEFFTRSSTTTVLPG